MLADVNGNILESLCWAMCRKCWPGISARTTKHAGLSSTPFGVIREFCTCWTKTPAWFTRSSSGHNCSLRAVNWTCLGTASILFDVKGRFDTASMILSWTACAALTSFRKRMSATAWTRRGFDRRQPDEVNPHQQKRGAVLYPVRQRAPPALWR